MASMGNNYAQPAGVSSDYDLWLIFANGREDA
jgi:hypothetical protein